MLDDKRPCRGVGGRVMVGISVAMWQAGFDLVADRVSGGIRDAGPDIRWSLDLHGLHLIAVRIKIGSVVEWDANQPEPFGFDHWRPDVDLPAVHPKQQPALTIS